MRLPIQLALPLITLMAGACWIVGLRMAGVG